MCQVSGDVYWIADGRRVSLCVVRQTGKLRMHSASGSSRHRTRLKFAGPASKRQQGTHTPYHGPNMHDPLSAFTSEQIGTQRPVYATTQSSLKLKLYMVLSTVFSIFFQSERRCMNSYISWMPSVTSKDPHVQTYFRSIRASIARDIPDDLREILSVFHDVHMTQHLEVSELCGDRGHLCGKHERP